MDTSYDKALYYNTICEQKFLAANSTWRQLGLGSKSGLVAQIERHYAGLAGVPHTFCSVAGKSSA